MKAKLILGLALIFSCQAFSIESVNHYELAVRAYDLGKSDEAFIHLKNAIQTNPSHLPSKLLLGKVYFNSGNIAAAEQELTQALQLGADINLVLPLLGSSLILQKKVDKLLQYEDQYYNLAKEGKFEWHLLRGQAYIVQSQPELAGFEFKEAQQLFPDNIRANSALATLYIRLERLDEAETLINHAVEVEPENEKVWQLRGELALKQGKQDKAYEYFHHAYELDSDDPKILRSLTLSLLNKGDTKQAKKLNDAILEQSPNDPTAVLINAWFLSNAGKQEEAKARLEKLSQEMSLLDPATMLYDRNTTMLYGIAELMQGNLESSQKLLLKYIEEGAGDPNALKILAQVYVQSGKYDDALSLLEDKQRIVTNNLELGVLLIQLYLHENNLFRAEQTHNKLVANFPDEPYLSIIQARIYDIQDREGIALATLNSVKLKEPSTQFLLLKGKLLLKNGEIEKARTVADNLLAENSQNVDALNLLSGILLSNGDYEKGQNVIEKVLSLSPNNISATFNKALVFKNKREFSKARNILQSIVSHSPSHRATLLELSELELLENNYDAAESWINKLLAYEQDNTNAKRKLSTIYMAQQKWSDALLIVSRLLQNDRLNPALLLQQAKIYSAMRNNQAASSNFTVVYELWLTDPEKLHFLAKQQIKANDLDGARKSLSKILSLTSDHYNAKIDLARLSLMQDKPEEAQQLIGELEGIDNNTGAIYLLKGDLASYVKDYAQAVDNYLQSIKLEPDSKTALVKLYLLSKDDHGVEKFFAVSESLLQQNPQTLWKRKLLADAYLDHHHWEKAQQHYQLLLNSEEFKDSPAIFNNLANIYMKTDLDKALNTAMLGLHNGGDKNPALLDTLGWIKAKQKQYTEALAYLREAYVLDSNNPEIHYHLGHTLYKLERDDEARIQLRAATKNENFPEYQDAVLLLENLN